MFDLVPPALTPGRRRHPTARPGSWWANSSRHRRFNLRPGGNRQTVIFSLIIWCLIKPTLLAIDDQPLLCDCGPSGPCASCEPA